VEKGGSFERRQPRSQSTCHIQANCRLECSGGVSSSTVSSPKVPIWPIVWLFLFPNLSCRRHGRNQGRLTGFAGAGEEWERFLDGSTGRGRGIPVDRGDRDPRLRPQARRPRAVPGGRDAARRAVRDVGDRISELKRLRIAGTLDIGAAKGAGQIEILLENGDRLDRHVSAQGKLIETTVVDRGRAWRIVAGRPAEELKGLFLEQAIVTNPILRLDDWRKSHETVEVVCKSRLGEEDVWVVRAKPTLLPASTKYVSVQTGLLFKEEAWITSKGIGTVPLSIEFGDSREVGGVLMPFRVASDNVLTGRQVGHSTEVEANPKLADNAFSISKGAQ